MSTKRCPRLESGRKGCAADAAAECVADCVADIAAEFDLAADAIGKWLLTKVPRPTVPDR
jgi:hypothetical protein